MNSVWHKVYARSCSQCDVCGTAFIYHQHDTLETLSLLTSALTLLSGLIYNCLADQGEDTNSPGAYVVFALVCAINLVTVTYAVYVAAATLIQSAKNRRMQQEEEETRKRLVRSKAGRLDKKALEEQKVLDKWDEMVEKQQKYDEAERTVETAKASLARISRLLPEYAEDIQLDLISPLNRFDEFLDLGREKCAHLLERYAAVDLAGVDELSADALAQLQSGPKLTPFQAHPLSPPPPKSGEVNPRKSSPASASVSPLTSSSTSAAGALSTGLNVQT